MADFFGTFYGVTVAQPTQELKPVIPSQIIEK